jgi:hypothetical protein
MMRALVVAELDDHLVEMFADKIPNPYGAPMRAAAAG